MDKNDCATPFPFFDLFNKEFWFDQDVAANRQNRKCPQYLGPDHEDPTRRDALNCSWACSTCWMNPPYKNIQPWLEKAHEESLRGTLTVALVHADTSTKRWERTAHRAAYILLVTGTRIRFVRPDGEVGKSNTKPSAVLVFHPEVTEACTNARFWRPSEPLRGLDPSLDALMAPTQRPSPEF